MCRLSKVTPSTFAIANQLRWISPPLWVALAWAASAQGTIKPNMDVVVMEGQRLFGTPAKGRINQVLKFQGLERIQATEAGPGDIVLINGIDDNWHWCDHDRPFEPAVPCPC